MDEFVWLDATAQAELVRNKEVKPLELVDAAIARIERLNPQINAVVTPMYEQARKLAAAPLPEGPFTGVPFLLKDLVAMYQGVRTTSGSSFLKDFVAFSDSRLVERYKAAGLIVVGKTNTPEFGIVPTTESQALGACHNPWDLSVTPGGSSGGSAAAVAAGFVPMAHANDGGGSIRIPASCCGLFGLKPTRARNPLGPNLGDALMGLIAEHAVTRSVRDSATLLDATSGYDPGDPYCAPAQVRPFIEEVTTAPGKLRIGFSTQALNGVEVHPDCIAAVETTVKLCTELGHELVETHLAVDNDLLTQSFMAVWTAGVAANLEGWARLTRQSLAADKFEPLTWALYEMGQTVAAKDLLLASGYFNLVSRYMAQFMSQYDILLCPTLGEPPVPLGTLDSPAHDPLQGFFRAAQFVPFTPLFNITGQPAMSVPLSWNQAGLPIGVHFAARFGDEATLFRLAGQLEEAHPWRDRHPSLG